MSRQDPSASARIRIVFNLKYLFFMIPRSIIVEFVSGKTHGDMAILRTKLNVVGDKKPLAKIRQRLSLRERAQMN